MHVAILHVGKKQKACLHFTSHHMTAFALAKVTGLISLVDRAGALDKYDVTDGVQYVETYDAHTFLWPLYP